MRNSTVSPELNALYNEEHELQIKLREMPAQTDPGIRQRLQQMQLELWVRIRGLEGKPTP